ncbi:uncharacterized protein LOC106155375 [Lingula anatina]|uniref:Uncharacterized protein LOC106155375 n=1 Tax=Lingula anatina TaxID=7574 RepID=A0A1S3HHP8_LINAN|nr:uncharacterized protein LOC106155375 [Lingula anatina]|eukprot:XP_013385628.1 uncharacterized protein LOC106155375 [Lingula anatina]
MTLSRSIHRYRDTAEDEDENVGWPYTHTWVSRTSGLSPRSDPYPNSIPMATKPYPWREPPPTYFNNKGFSSVEDDAPSYPGVHNFERYDSSRRNPSSEDRGGYSTYPPRPTDPSIHRKVTENEWEELEDFYGANFSESASRRTPSRSMHEYIPWQLQFDHFNRTDNHWIPRPKTSPRPNRYF